MSGLALAGGTIYCVLWMAIGVLAAAIVTRPVHVLGAALALLLLGLLVGLGLLARSMLVDELERVTP